MEENKKIFYAHLSITTHYQHSSVGHNFVLCYTPALAAQGRKAVKRRGFRTIFLIDKGNCTTELAHCAAPSPQQVAIPLRMVWLVVNRHAEHF